MIDFAAYASNPAVVGPLCGALGVGIAGFFNWRAAHKKSQPEMAAAIASQIQIIFEAHTETITWLQQALDKAQRTVEDLSAKLEDATVKLGIAEHKIDDLNAQLQNTELRQTFQSGNAR